VRGKLAVEVLCGARGGRCRGLVGRLWWTPEPEPLLLNTDEIVQYRLPRDLRYAQQVLMECNACDGNKGHNFEDVYGFLRKPFLEFEAGGRRKPMVVTLQRLTTR
jgi:hypothetical protein